MPEIRQGDYVYVSDNDGIPKVGKVRKQEGAFFLVKIPSEFNARWFRADRVEWHPQNGWGESA